MLNLYSMNQEAMSKSSPLSPKESEKHRILDYHLSLIRKVAGHQGLQEARTAPIFTMPVLEHVETRLSENVTPSFPQYGLLAGLTESVTKIPVPTEDPRVFFNIASPSSTFICGSQGSGKSHTLSCLLENCLISSEAGQLPHPLTGLVFHYDTVASDEGGSPCEAAFLSSNPSVTVRVLCSPANVRTIKASLQIYYYFLRDTNLTSSISTAI